MIVSLMFQMNNSSLSLRKSKSIRVIVMCLPRRVSCHPPTFPKKIWIPIWAASPEKKVNQPEFGERKLPYRIVPSFFNHPLQMRQSSVTRSISDRRAHSWLDRTPASTNNALDHPLFLDQSVGRPSAEINFNLSSAEQRVILANSLAACTFILAPTWGLGARRRGES